MSERHYSGACRADVECGCGRVVRRSNYSPSSDSCVFCDTGVTGP